MLSFQITNPRKGTETLYNSTFMITIECFQITNPRKGTETKGCSSLLDICISFQITNPRKGTETIYVWNNPLFGYLFPNH